MGRWRRWEVGVAAVVRTQSSVLTRSQCGESPQGKQWYPLGYSGWLQNLFRMSMSEVTNCWMSVVKDLMPPFY